MQRKLSVGVVVTAYRSHSHLPHCLPHLVGSPDVDRVVVVNASGHDGTQELVHSLKAEYLDEPYYDYNHGLTREKARRFLGTDIVVMVTADAYAKDTAVIGHLIQPIVEGKAALAYARQLPKQDAQFFEAWARIFNYPDQSHIRSWDERSKWGVYTIFFSDSFGAYLSSAVDRAGGFPHVLLGEDTLMCARLLELGEKVAYVSEAQCYHSHTYTLLQEFQRHFDAGLCRQEMKDVIQKLGSDQKRGSAYAQALLRDVIKTCPQRIFYATAHLFSKWLGYQTGFRLGKKLTLSAKRRLSSQKFFWDQQIYS